MPFSSAEPTKGVSHTRGHSITPSLNIDSLDRPIVAWADASQGNYEIYLRLFSGQWLDHFRSASVGGISNSTGPSLNPRLAIRKLAEPNADGLTQEMCVSYSEANSTSLEIVMRCSAF